MQQYPAYKDSEVSWVGEIPVHWCVKPIKHFVAINPETLPENTSPDFEIEYIDIGNVSSDGLTNPPEKMTFGNAPSRARRIVERGDTIISTVRTYLKAVAFIDSEQGNLIASTGFAVLRGDGKVDSRFLRYAVLCHTFVESVTANSVGVSYPAINSSAFGRLKLPFPPSLDEQKTIADFLEEQTAVINQFLTNKRRLIALLEEQKQVVINTAVTQGLDPTAPRKPSGIDWLGDIPAHWERKKVKHIGVVCGRIGFRGYTTNDLVDPEEGALTLGATQITSDGLIDLTKSVYISWVKYYESPEIMVSEGDIVIVQRGSTCGKVGFIVNDYGPMTINPSLVLLKQIEILNSYFFYFLKSKVISALVNSITSSTAIPMLSQAQIGEFPVLVPPASEQMQIVKFIETKTAEINVAIERTQREIELIEEYRTTLIAHAVTGKIDVRQAV